MGKKKKGELLKYLKELVTFDINLGEPIKDDE